MNHKAEDWFQTGMHLVGQGRMPDAAGAFQNALLLKPDYHEAWANRGNVLHGVGHHFDAILNYNQAIAIKESAEYFNNRGATWIDLGSVDAAMSDYRTALRINPQLAEAESNMGNACKHLGRIREAREHYAKAVEIRPDYIDGQLNKSIMDLELGDFIEGFKGFEVRWKCGQLPPRGLPWPQWEGEDLSGKKILLYAEQGLGDAVHFIRYATEIKRDWPTATVSVEVRPQLTRLAKTVEGVDRVYAYAEEMEPQDYVCAMMSAPRVMGTTIKTIPAWPYYMTADPSRVAKWRETMAKELGDYDRRFKVGICWAGMSRPLQPIADGVNKRRSSKLSQWAPLASDDVIFISLQCGPEAQELKNPPAGMVIGDWAEGFDDFMDTAALMKCCDLIISVDTAVIHVAAAIGKPTWMLSRFDGCWRWMGDRPDSPWYPTLRQFRQKKMGDWDGLMKDVAKELHDVVKCRRFLEAAE